MKIVTAPAGTNPMEMPELIRRKRASKLQLFGLIGLAVLVLSCICGGSYYLYSNTRKASAAAVLSTETPTQTPTPTATSTPTGTLTITPVPSGTFPPISTLSSTSTPGRIPPTSTAIVITKIVPGQDRIIEKWYPVDRTVIVTVPVTMTPGPTQTPWIITITEVVINTVIVEVIPTPTETPTEEVIVIPPDPSPTDPVSP